MKFKAAPKCRHLTSVGMPASLFNLRDQGQPALGHQHEKGHIGHAEQRAECNVRQAARPPVAKGRRGVGQFIERADKDQVAVAPQITSRDQGIGNADYQHEHAKQCEIAAEPRQFVADAQRRKNARGEKGEGKAKDEIVKCGDGEKPPIIFFFGRFREISLY